jgi:tetratricopeptide (TPR) repeat protein
MAGNLTEARVRLESDILANQGDGDIANEDLSRYWLAQILNLEGNNDAAKRYADELAGRPAQPFSLFPLRYAVECACDARAGKTLKVAREKLEDIAARYPSTRSRGYCQYARALQASCDGQLADARKLMIQADALWTDLTSAFSLAEIYEAERDFPRALALYENVRSKRTTAVRWEQQIQWARSLAGAGRCLRALGRTSEAVERYNEFLRRWGTQTNLPLVREIAAVSAG